jgi:hypothetical protein
VLESNLGKGIGGSQTSSLGIWLHRGDRKQEWVLGGLSLQVVLDLSEWPVGYECCEPKKERSPCHQGQGMAKGLMNIFK